MAYRVEDKDIVIDGWANGIADSPHQGIADMRNIETIAIPTEASVILKNQAVTAPPVKNAVAYTAQNAGDTITPTGGTSGFYEGVAITLAANTAGGLSNGIVYYVFNITATTFQLRLAVASGSAVTITSDGTGTFTTYQYGNQRGASSSQQPVPITYTVDSTGQLSGSNGIYIVDGSQYLWVVVPNTSSGSATKNALFFLGNIGGIGASSTIRAGIAVWKGYVFLFGRASGNDQIDIAELSEVWAGAGPALTWDYDWNSIDPDLQSNYPLNRIDVLIGQDDTIYYTSNDGVGSLIENAGEVFDPTDTTTYTFNSAALVLPDNDKSTCLGELGINLLVGGVGNNVYPWDRISPSFTYPLIVPDAFIRNIVGTNQNAYIFSGQRGRIFITNGSTVDPFRKIPDYVTGKLVPNFTFIDATYNRNELLFSFSCRDNADNLLTTVNGVWAINFDTQALRLLNKVTGSGYSGTTSMIAIVPSSVSGLTSITGNGLMVGWNQTSTYGVDVGSSEPYSNFESYIETEIIPIGTYLKSFTPSQIEWKTSVPLGDNGTSESIRISYRSNLNDTYTEISTSTSSNGTINGMPAVSDLYKANFEKVQWVQLLIEMSSNSTTPTFCRLTEVRIRDWPSA